ncbi:MAG: sigma-70 family RNA polymerase sigma factor [Planctomycetaceae bacterium]|nr:sigma-70 family RNA polymerase sigma factor [Planctomycetaceae bacterium]
MNDTELVDGLRQRRPAAVAHLMDCYVPSLWRCVYVRAHGDRHVTEDVVSEVVLALLKAVADQTVEIVHPMAWLRGVAFHKLQDYYRAAARVQHLIDQAETAERHDHQPDPAAHHERSEQRATIRKVMDGLDEQHRLILEWKYIDGLSVREIAGRFAVTEKAAESILFRARREFRQAMPGTNEDDEEPEAQGNLRNHKTVTEPSSIVAQSGQDERVTQR